MQHGDAEAWRRTEKSKTVDREMEIRRGRRYGGTEKK
jgi:hypothetical protein